MEGCPLYATYEPMQVEPAAPVPLPVQKLTKCQQEQLNASKSGAADIFVPVCEPSGNYKKVQCYTFPGSGRTDCWCVSTSTGDEIPGTRVTGKTPDCKGIN